MYPELLSTSQHIPGGRGVGGGGTITGRSSSEILDTEGMWEEICPLDEECVPGRTKPGASARCDYAGVRSLGVGR